MCGFDTKFSGISWDSARVTLVLFRRRALGKQCGAEQRLGRAFEKAVRRKPLARRTRSLCKLNGANGGIQGAK